MVTEPSSSKSRRKGKGRTVSGAIRSPEGVRRQIEDTATDDTTHTATAGRYLDKTRTDMTDSPTQSTGTVGDFGESSFTPGELIDGAEAPAKRYEMLEQIGTGGAGRVYAMRDNSLKRVIAVKFLQRQDKPAVRRHFVREAQVTAMLEHPNIMPIYDLGVTGRNQVYYAMKKVGGVTLGEAIRGLREGRDAPEEFAALDGRVRILLKVCDALAYAHSRGFIHQDIKPDNIMLGQYGEVLVLDWGSAVEKGPTGVAVPERLCGTPAYMSPEQARREAVDERSDVYCLGATMFHMLTLRHPVWAPDPDTFWEKKRAGVIDPPTPLERHRVPLPLLKIALKALEPDPARRYPSIVALANDLKRYQAGLAVSVHRENPFEAFLRWYRRNRRVFWLAAALVIGVGTVGALLFREKIQEMITWRRFGSEDFSYSSTEELAGRWKGYVSANWIDLAPEPFSDSGGWRVAEGALVGSNVYGAHNITFRQPIPGDIRVEWSVTPLLKNTNLNCYIAGETRSDGYTFHVGGFEYSDMVTLTRQTSAEVLERRPLGQILEVSKTYRLRMEREGSRLRFYLNGRQVLAYTDYDVLSGPGHQTFGFENNNGNRIRIDNVEIYYHPMPLKVSPLVAADRLFALGHYRDALTQYREIQEQYAGREIARIAWYKSALCLERLDSTVQALETLALFDHTHPRDELTPQAGFDRYRILTELGDTVRAESCLRELGRRFPGHRVLRTALNAMAARCERRMRRVREQMVGPRMNDPALAAVILTDARRIRDWAQALGIPPVDVRFLSDAVGTLYGLEALSFEDMGREFPALRGNQADALLDVGDYVRVLSDYSDQRTACARALNAQGNYRLVARRYPDARAEYASALFALGRLEEVVARFPDYDQICADALWRQGRLDEALSRYPQKTAVLATAVGRYHEYLAAVRTVPADYASALLSGLGLADSALTVLNAADPMGDLRYYILLGQTLMELGRSAEFIARFKQTQPLAAMFADAWCRMGRPDSALAYYRANQGARAMAFAEMGEYDSVLACPREEQLCIRALWLAGRHTEVLTRYAGGPLQRAAILLHEGRFKDVVERCPDIRDACAKALYGLRRYRSILRYYPDQRQLCQETLLAMGMAEQMRTLYPDSRALYADYLLQAGRAQEIVDSFPDQRWQYACALLAVGREDHLERQPWKLSAQEMVDYAAVRAIHYAGRGDYRRALATLRTPRVWSCTWHANRFSHLLLEPVLMGLAGDTTGMRAHCRRIAELYAGTMGRQLWYEAGWLAGDISDELFLEQPCRYFVRERLVLLKAIRADVGGEHDEARRLYRVLRETPHCRKPWLRQVEGVNSQLQTLLHNTAVRRFIDWRFEALGGETAAGKEVG